MGSVRVILAEDSALFRKGLARLLEDGGIEIAAEVGDGRALLGRIAADPPDVAIVDIRMPPTHTTEGIDAAIEIRSRFPEVGVLVLSHHLEAEYAVELLESSTGGVGYLLKDRVTDPLDLIEAVRRIAGGGTVIDSDVVARLILRPRSPLDPLSEREREVLAAMAEGYSNAAIADKLYMSVKTVETHIRSIFVKLGLGADSDVHRRVLAAVTWLRAQ